MLDRTIAPAADSAREAASLARRRALYAALTAATMVGLMSLAVVAVPPRGVAAVLFLALFTLTLPWSVVGFWNATIGFLLLTCARDPVAAVNPMAARIRGDETITARTAILMCIRNEAPAQVTRNLRPLMDGLASGRVAHLFHVYLLSDSSDPEIVAAEEACFGAFAAECGGGVAITYRRRETNTGFKAGNIRDFCDRWGGGHEFAITLDADSFMPAEPVLRLVRIMQANPTLGILQTLVIGLPSPSAFARLFQFGMRLGMRSYTLGRRLVAGRLRTLLGPQRHSAPRAFRRALPPADVAGERPARRPYPEPRSGRGRADAPRRLRGQGFAVGGNELGGKPADADGIHPPRSALVPGQHAIFAAARLAGTEADQPRAAGVRDPDVCGLARLDGAGGDRRDRNRAAPAWRALRPSM